ncbi:MAG: hypothetical protein NW237_03480 [Cyanobacteriota bacterium]|nr:hypothetical protein [Cyanobacteriota bacterium]
MDTLGKYLTLTEFCTCTQTYRRLSTQIEPFPQNSESIKALTALAENILDPLIDHYGRDHFQLTYGFCSTDLKRFLALRDPVTGRKSGIVSPHLDQHMAHEINRNGKPYCERLGAAADFRILGFPSDQVVDWILAAKLPFDSLYFYGVERPIHISYGSQHKRDIWTFLQTGQPTRKGIQHWVELAKLIPQ